MSSQSRWFDFGPHQDLRRFELGATIVLLGNTAHIDEAWIVRHLTDDERAHSQRILAPQRRSEYLRSRWALRVVAKRDFAVGRQASGEPCWPSDISGSITHKEGAVAVAIVPPEVSLGIDLESISRVAPHLSERIATKEELRLMSQGVQEVPLASLFAAKEALYKCHFPMGKTFFGFHDATCDSITFDGVSGVITGVVNMRTTPLHDRGSSWTANFMILEVDGKPMTLACVKTDVR